MLTARFSIFYFCFFLFLAFQVAFFPLYVEGLGFSSAEVALASIGTALSVVIGCPLAQTLAHRAISSKLLFIVCLLLSFLLFLPLFGSTGFLIVSVSWLFCLIPNKGAHALVDTRAIRGGKLGEMSYDVARAWGSIGFIVGSLYFGKSIDLFGKAGLLNAAFASLIIASLAGVLVYSTLRHTAHKKEIEQPESIQKAFEWSGEKSFFALLTSWFLLWSSHQVFFVYYSLHLESLGWSGVGMSLNWSLGVLVEIIVFFRFAYLERKYSLSQIHLFSIVSTTLSWVMLYLLTDVTSLYLFQVLHGIAFGALYMSSKKLVFEVLPNNLQDRGLGYLMSVGAAGAILSRLAMAYLVQFYSYPELFFMSAGLSLLALGPFCFGKSKRPS